jgi:methylenetetrahydrofolate reductase (NADPH)
MPIKGALEAANHLPANAEVTVSCSPTLGIENTLALAEELSRRGFRVVAHLAARLVTGKGHLNKLLRRMEDGGLREVFVVGGDSKVPAGPYASGLSLLKAMSRLGAGIERVGVPAYPEGHPLVAEEKLMRALLAKQPFASYAVTQICFEPAKVLGWLAHARERGLKLPVYVGIPGVLDRKKLLRIALKMGIGDSARYLRKQPGVTKRLTARDGYTPDALVRSLVPHVGDTERGIWGFHLSTFNQAEATERWWRDMLAPFDREEVREGKR